MTLDPELSRALEAALVAQPDQHAIRLHLAELLAQDGQHAAALGHCEVVLRADPENRQAAELAAGARQGLGISPGSPPIHASGPTDAEADERLPDDRRTEISDALLAELTRPEVTLDDVAGMEDVKARVRAAFLEPIHHEEVSQLYGTAAGGGMLLFGPPGCGKTLLARALAGEMGVYFLSLELHEILDMWLGNSEKNLHAVFQTAREMAPSVLFIDELDALGHRRSNLRNANAMRTTVNQLLMELDGVRNDNDGVYFLGATNEPWDIDPALRRPGRFDRSILVLPPDEDARSAILAANLRGRLVGEVDLGQIASRTPLFTGADLKLVCQSAAQNAATRAIRTGETLPITTADLQTSAAEIEPTGTVEWMRRAHAYAQVTDDSTAFASLSELMRRHRL